MNALALKKYPDLKLLVTPTEFDFDEIIEAELDFNNFDNGLEWAKQILMDYRSVESQRQVQ